MNIQNYELFISDIKNQHRGLEKEDGFEIHHIIPKALGGSNDDENLADFEIESLYSIDDFNKIREEAISMNRKRMKEDNPMKKEENRKKASKSLKKFYSENPEKTHEMSIKLKNLYEENPELREKASIRQREICRKNPEQTIKNITRMRKAIEEDKEAYSNKLKEVWNRPNYKESRSGENHPMKKEENRKKASNNMINLWKDENYKLNQSVSIKNGWDNNKRKSQSEKTMNYYNLHPERKDLFRESVKDFWSNEENKKRISEQRKNTFWFNNGIKNVKVSKCPEGFTPGRLKSNKCWYTNGADNIMTDKCPEGFYKGRTLNKKENINE